MITNYKELSLGAYLKILAIAEACTDPLERNPDILSVLDGRPVHELERLPLPEFAALMQKANFLCKPPQPGRARNSYPCGPFVLRPTLDYKKITASQYIDFQEIAKNEKDGVPPLVEILSCLMVPVGKRYCEDYDPQEVREAMRMHLSTEDAITLYSFFIARLLISMRRLATSSEKALKRLKPRPETEAMIQELRARMMEMDSQINGVGLLMLMPFQRLSELLGMTSGE